MKDQEDFYAAGGRKDCHVDDLFYTHEWNKYDFIHEWIKTLQSRLEIWGAPLWKAATLKAWLQPVMENQTYLYKMHFE